MSDTETGAGRAGDDRLESTFVASGWHRWEVKSFGSKRIHAT